MNKKEITKEIKKLSERIIELTILLDDELKMPIKPKQPYDIIYSGNQKQEIEKLFELAFKEYGIFKSAIIGKSRKRELIILRHVIAYIMYFKIDMTLEGIGFLMEKDHSSILHMKNSIVDKLSVKDEKTVKVYSALINYKK